MLTIHSPFFSSKYCSFMVAGQFVHSWRVAEKLKSSSGLGSVFELYRDLRLNALKAFIGVFNQQAVVSSLRDVQ